MAGVREPFSGSCYGSEVWNADGSYEYAPGERARLKGGRNGAIWVPAGKEKASKGKEKGKGKGEKGFEKGKGKEKGKGGKEGARDLGWARPV